MYAFQLVELVSDKLSLFILDENRKEVTYTEYKLLSEEIPEQATILAALDVIKETCVKSTCESCPLNKKGACMVEKIPVYWKIDTKILNLKENKT